MGVSTSRKLLAVRQLYERWNAPLPVLGEATGLKLSRLQARALKENWIGGHSANTMLNKLTGVFDQHMEIIAQRAGGEVCDEKRARALSVMAKTLESIAAVASRLAAIESSENTKSKQIGKENEPTGVDANRTADLDRQLAELVQNLS